MDIDRTFKKAYQRGKLGNKITISMTYIIFTVILISPKEISLGSINVCYN